VTEHHERTGAPRDVPPPRPVAVPPGSTTTEAPESPLARAGRLLAEAASGLLGGAAAPGGSADDPGPDVRRSAGSTLRDVASAVASAVGAARASGPAAQAAAPGPQEAAPGGRPDRTPGAVLGDLLSAAAPRLPIRDRDRLRAAYPGASDEEIADALVARAARLTTGIGAATGGIWAAQWLAPPSLLALPLELGAETVLVAAVEVVLLGELHELHGRPAAGDARQRAAAYLAGWSEQRPVEPGAVAGLTTLLSGAALRGLRHRLTRRLVRGVPGAAPFLVGAALGGRGNRRATELLAARVRGRLRGARP
jgi:hypothetical protein